MMFINPSAPPPFSESLVAPPRFGKTYKKWAEPRETRALECVLLFGSTLMNMKSKFSFTQSLIQLTIHTLIVVVSTCSKIALSSFHFHFSFSLFPSFPFFNEFVIPPRQSADKSEHHLLIFRYARVFPRTFCMFRRLLIAVFCLACLSAVASQRFVYNPKVGD